MVEFREVSPGEYFPPTLPNGRFFAQAAGGRDPQEILTVTDVGLECGGVSFSLGGHLGVLDPGRASLPAEPQVPLGWSAVHGWHLLLRGA